MHMTDCSSDVCYSKLHSSSSPLHVSCFILFNRYAAEKKQFVGRLFPICRQESAGVGFHYRVNATGAPPARVSPSGQYPGSRTYPAKGAHPPHHRHSMVTICQADDPIASTKRRVASCMTSGHIRLGDTNSSLQDPEDPSQAQRRRGPGRKKSERAGREER